MEAERGDDGDDILFGEATGAVENTTQAAVKEQVFGKEKDETTGKSGSGLCKMKKEV